MSAHVDDNGRCVGDNGELVWIFDTSESTVHAPP